LLGIRRGGPFVVDSGNGVVASDLSLGVPGFAMVCRIVSCGVDPLAICDGDKFISSSAAFTLGTRCHGEVLEVGFNKDGFGAAVGLRLACCCCFFLSFCDILCDDESSDDL
jgi:hypothetical protein